MRCARAPWRRASCRRRTPPGSVDAPSTTWLLVTITPSDEITKPVPAAPPESGPPSSTIATTAGTSACRIVRDVAGPGDPVGRAHDHRGRGRGGRGGAVVADGEVDARRDQRADEPAHERATRAVRRPSPWARSRRFGGTGGGGPTSDSTGATGGAAIHAGPIGAVGGTGAAGLRPGGSPPRSVPSPARPASPTAPTEWSAPHSGRSAARSAARSTSGWPRREHATLRPPRSPRMVTNRTAAERPALPPSPRGAAVGRGSRARDPPPGVGVVRTCGTETSASTDPYPEPRVAGT